MSAKKKRTSPSDPDGPERLRARISELLRDYANAKDRIAELEAELKADRAEAYYWRTEAMTLRSDLVSQLRESARTKPWPDVS